MELVGLKGTRARLVPADKTLHLENAIRWMNDPEVTRYLNLNIGVSRGMEEEWLERMQKRENDFVWAILDDHDQHIGFSGIHQIHWRYRTARTGTVIGEKSAWGHGFGSDAMAIRTRFAFETLGLHRLESEANSANIASQRALEKTGYKREGLARKSIYAEGSWHDKVLYGFLEEDYFASR